MNRSYFPRRLRSLPVFLTLVAATAVFIRGSWAELTPPQPRDRQIAKTVTLLLKHDHLTGREVDQEMSRRCLHLFLKSLDPMKVYFLQSDIDEFSRSQDQLGELVKKGDVGFAYKVFETFLKRIDERVKLADEFLAMKHDFTVDEEMVSDPDAAKYAGNEAEARDLWRKRIKYDLLVAKADNKDAKEAKKEDDKAIRERLARRYHSFAKRMRQTDSDELLEMYLSSLTSAYDPHTNYMSPSTLENFEISMRLKLEGIGAALQFVDGFTVVKNLVPGGAADKDGRLKAEDKVVGVGQGQTGEIADVVDMKLNDVVKLIRGPRNTVVRLAVIPVGQTERKIYNITRAQIELKDSEARSQVFEEGKKPNGKPYKLGVIDLPSFYMDMEAARQRVPDYKSTTRDVKKILTDFNAQGVDAVILDLRRNGGGSLTESIDLTGLFLGSGPIVQVKGPDGNVQHYDYELSDAVWKGPLVVLTSKFSASASEIFAGAIQDYRRGLIVGDHSTHGKGTVQSLMDLGRQLFGLFSADKLGALKITIQQFYRPNGDSTQNRGVLADVELPSLTSQLDVGESDLDYALKFDRVPAASFNRLDLVNDAILVQLRNASAQRCGQSKDFQKVMKDIARYRIQKDRKKITLNEVKFMAERAELNADKEQDKKIEELNSTNRPVVERDFYFNEVLAITSDYLRLFGLAKSNSAVVGGSGRDGFGRN
ncbi:MAG: carboxy terminal-processing peptidase [Pirellulales bacterium]